MIKRNSTSRTFNKKIPPIQNRPRCMLTDCIRPKEIHKTSKDGHPYYRPLCSYHYNQKLAIAHDVEHVDHITAKRKKLSLSEYRNLKHPYRKHRKDYCENKDGRLGFTCTTTITWIGMLDVDHINGKRTDNRPANLQTLCKCCHAFKTALFKDS